MNLKEYLSKHITYGTSVCKVPNWVLVNQSICDADTLTLLFDMTDADVDQSHPTQAFIRESYNLRWYIASKESICALTLAYKDAVIVKYTLDEVHTYITEKFTQHYEWANNKWPVMFEDVEHDPLREQVATEILILSIGATEDVWNTTPRIP